MAVGRHAVNKARIVKGEGALVLGCGPVGLAVIAALKLDGIEPIVAADFSPARRALATTMGAHEVVDPAAETAFEAWTRVGGGKQLVVFEAIGVPGIIDAILRVAPPQHPASSSSECAWRPTASRPSSASARSSTMQFCLGYDPMEFAGTLRSIAEGETRRHAADHRRGRPRRRPGAVRGLGNPDAPLQDPRQAERLRPPAARAGPADG